jgi:uncharacterized repeat protein (TIGR03803 family)
MRLVRLLACFLAILLFAVTYSFGAATETIVHSFIMHGNGSDPSGGLVADGAGNLYGATTFGGAYEFGAAFRLSPDGKGGWTETVIYSFAGIDDAHYPTGALTLDSAGNLYGVTMWGAGVNGSGAIYELSPTASGPWIETVLYTFNVNDSKAGFNPNGGLIFDKAGNLYGTAEYGGGYITQGCSFDGGCGTVFKLSPNSNGSWTETVLYAFKNESGGWLPKTGLIMDNAGNLYGTTSVGGSGSSPDGVVFELSPSGSSWTETVLHSFSGGSDGNGPNSLIFDSAGNLDGTTTAGGGSSTCFDGCGTVFQLSPSASGWSEHILYVFTGAGDGDTPGSGLALDKAGNLFGSTTDDSTTGLGAVFELSPNANGPWTETVLWSLPDQSLGQPLAGVILGSTGQLLGTTGAGFFQTVPSNGSVFALNNKNGSWTHTTLYAFPNSDGGDVQGMVADSSGNFYGTTSRGGANGVGTVFKLLAGTGTETPFFSFTTALSQTIGSLPSAPLLDAAGNIYGETAYGGPHGQGMVYELSPTGNGGWAEKILYGFSGGPDGNKPQGGLTLDAQGNLYGTTQFGGNAACSKGCGTVFQLSPTGNGSWTRTILYLFSGPDGNGPLASLVFDQAGNLYGTTGNGGSSGKGTVFELSPSAGGWTEKVLYSFTNAHGDGGHPHAGLIFDSVGNLYGTAATGGSLGPNCFVSGCGTVFQLSPSGNSWTETTLLKFTGANGADPVAPLVMDAAGNLYGTSRDGLNGYWGSVFELSPAGNGWTTTILHVFLGNGAPGGDGLAPVSGLIVDSSGNLYGTTSYGGQAGWGTVFQITP